MSSSRVVPPLRRRPGNRRENTDTTSDGGNSGDSVNAVGADAGVGVDDLCDENVPLVTRREDETAYSIAMAEAEVLKAR